MEEKQVVWKYENGTLSNLCTKEVWEQKVSYGQTFYLQIALDHKV